MRDLIHELNHMAPAASHAELGTQIETLIRNQNTILALMDASGAFLAATETVTVGGAIAAGDTLTVTLTNPVIGALEAGHPVVVVAAAGDTDTSISGKIATAINADATLEAVGITATSAAAALALAQPGQIGNLTHVTVATGGAETFAFTNSGTFAGGFGTFGNGNLAALGMTTLEALGAMED